MVFLVHQLQCFILKVVQHFMGMQPLTPLGEKRKGKHEINVSTAEIDERQHSPGYYKQTEAATAFRQASQPSQS